MFFQIVMLEKNFNQSIMKLRVGQLHSPLFTSVFAKETGFTFSQLCAFAQSSNIDYGHYLHFLIW